MVANVGLNPSTADEFRNDPTVHRDIERAARLEFGSLLKLNLFSIRSTDPRGMLKAEDPYGDWRDVTQILDSAERHQAEMILATWGNHGARRRRSKEFTAEVNKRGLNLWAFDLNKTGEPIHPLYKPYSIRPLLYLPGGDSHFTH